MEQTASQQSNAFSAAGLTPSQVMDVGKGISSAKPPSAPSITPDASAMNPANSTTMQWPSNSPSPASVASSANNANIGIPGPIQAIQDGAKQTPGEKTNQDLLTQKAQAIGGNTSLAGLQNSAEAAAGVPGLTSIVNDYTAQLQGLADQSTALQNEAAYTIPNQQQLDASGRIVSQGGIAPHQADALRLNQIKQGQIATQSLTIKSAWYAAQGKLTLAKDAAEKAAQAQFGAQQQKIDYLNAMIDANKPQMTKEEAAQADTTKAQLALYQQQLDEAKANKVTIMGWVAEAQKANPNNPAVQMAVQSALQESNGQQPNLQKAFSLLGNYLSDPNATNLALIQVEQARADLKLTNANISKVLGDVKKASAPGNGLSDLAKTVIDNPELFNQLTPTDKAKIAPELAGAGFNAFGKPFPQAALTAINQTDFAITSLQDLRSKLTSNLDKLGPITGLSALNPYSESRKIQADIDRVRQTVGKALEGGVLRKEDEEKYKKILATITDTPDTAIYKIDALMNSIQSNLADYKRLQYSAGHSDLSSPGFEVKTGALGAPSAQELQAKYNY